MTNSWGSDTAVSMPVPLTAADLNDVSVDMQGFRFSPKGLQHDITKGDIEAIMLDRYAPKSHNEQRGDAEFD